MRGCRAAVTLMTAAAMLTGIAACGNAEGASPECAGKDTLTAEGSTTQETAMAVFAQSWEQRCPGKTLKYVPTGSGDGRQKWIASEFDFAGSDSPLPAEQVPSATERCAGNPAWNIPLTFSAITLPYHLEGVPNLTLNGSVLAQIFNGTMTTWDDPQIAMLNPDVVMPTIPIVAVFRQDPTGLTNDLQKYFTAVAPRVWTQGTGSQFVGGIGLGAEQTAGVLDTVRTTPGAIGYVAMNLALGQNLSLVSVDSGFGSVAPTLASATTAVDGAEFVQSDNDLAINTNSMFRTREPGGYPLLQVTYEIVCSKGYDAETAAAVRSFLTAAASDGQAGLAAVGSVPLPRMLRLRILDVVALIA